MISRILLPTDFSEVATNALKFAIDLCKKNSASLHILHVKQIPVLDTSFPTDTYQLFIDEVEKAAVKGLADMTSTYLNNSGITFQTKSVTGFIVDEVLNYGEQNEIDLIVMGTTGASGIQELLVGSNAASLVAKSKLPVLVVPPSVTHVDFKHILYTSDYTEPEFPAFSRLVFFAEQYQAKITVLHVKTEFDMYFASAQNFFARNKDHISVDNITFVTAPNNHVIEEIDKYVNEKGVDMLVMAKHNRSFFDRLFHRSLSKRMTYHTKVPLLVLNK